MISAESIIQACKDCYNVGCTLDLNNTEPDKVDKIKKRCERTRELLTRAAETGLSGAAGLLDDCYHCEFDQPIVANALGRRP